MKESEKAEVVVLDLNGLCDLCKGRVCVPIIDHRLGRIYRLAFYKEQCHIPSTITVDQLQKKGVRDLVMGTVQTCATHNNPERWAKKSMSSQGEINFAAAPAK